MAPNLRFKKIATVLLCVVLFVIGSIECLQYYHKCSVEKRRRVPVATRLSVMKKLISVIYEAADSSYTNPFLFYGTLLGYVRDKDLICYDFDVDIGILQDDYDRFLVALKDAVRSKCPDLKLKCVNVFGYRRMILIHKETNINADIDEFYVKDNQMIKNMPEWYCKYWWKEKATRFPLNWILPFKRTDFNGGTIYIPANSEQVLRSYYGDGYTSPDHSCDNQCNCVKI